MKQNTTWEGKQNIDRRRKNIKQTKQIENEEDKNDRKVDLQKKEAHFPSLNYSGTGWRNATPLDESFVMIGNATVALLREELCRWEPWSKKS